ncbi:Lon protease-like protein 2 [Physocladia obscura]|uniref:Lon protease homolog n=1 Tax=Physocladia obscura TaxID=109957 RepID=A0AAD5XAZ7_9FUNG|nr:Lon protease-like protein 2 [Physocladia obscura]
MATQQSNSIINNNSNEHAVLGLGGGRVLFPGLVLRLQLQIAGGGSPRAVALMDHLARLVDHRHALVACVPSLPESDLRSDKENNTDSRSDKQTDKPAKVNGNSQSDEDLALDASRLAPFGVAARVVAFRSFTPSSAQKKNSKTQTATVSYLVALEGLYRIKIESVKKLDPFLVVAVTPFHDKATLKSTGLELANLLSQLQLPPQAITQLRKTISDAPAPLLADLLASMIDLSTEEKIEILGSVDVTDRVERVVELVVRQVQLEAIKKELGETTSGDGADSDTDPELSSLKAKLESLQMPEDASKATKRELARLARMPAQMPEHQIIRNYLEWMSEMPWNFGTGSDDIDVDKARLRLDADHFGMEGVKKRVLEYLAVGKLKKDLKGPILCLMGPPGVGKTSLGKSIANALGRKFHRISLGGVRDEAEIRGHRRTYIGALPGLIIQAMKKCGANDPVILLDEIDKVTRDSRGDPASALLEVLDPEQNSTFTDHYLNVPFDLSKVLFIATANDSETISAPLMDRMEVIQIHGYTFPEKLQIAASYLLPKQLKTHGLEPSLITIPDASLLKIATDYTRESGVRALEREIASVCRHLAVSYAQAQERHALDAFSGFVSPLRVQEILGAPKFVEEAIGEGLAAPGVVMGLAWTSDGAGGLLFIEAMRIRGGKGSLVLTGKLGDVIKESAQIGVSWVRANAARLGLFFGSGGDDGGNVVGDKRDIMEGIDVHIHFPAGATPKDGPSAGITIVTALVSLFSGRSVKSLVAMTGEISLRGKVHAVGGIKEKVLAAHRGGIKRVILPAQNKKDVDEIPSDVQKSIELCFVSKIDEVLELAFDGGFFSVEDSVSSHQLISGGGVFEAKL